MMECERKNFIDTIWNKTRKKTSSSSVDSVVKMKIIFKK